MKKETIEYALRTTWQQITNMYNEKALKYGGTMTMAFTLLSIDAEGTPSTTLGPKWVWKVQVCQDFLIQWRKEDLYQESRTQKMAGVYLFI